MWVFLGTSTGSALTGGTGSYRGLAIGGLETSEICMSGRIRSSDFFWPNSSLGKDLVLK